MIYKKGRYNLSATIFVPYDCNNNCPFCTSKKDYLHKENFDLDNIIATIKKLNNNTNVAEFVITGGEPFANIKGLNKIIGACEKDIYINTTLPKNTLKDTIELINTCEKIKGINISRHIGYEFNCVADINEINQIKKSVRINTVVNKNFSFPLFEEFISHYGKKKRDINLRADYRKITEHSLKSRDSIQEYCAENYDFLSMESCFVCNTEYYSYNNEFIISYHRGLEKSSIIFGNCCYVNDIIVKQDGKCYKDWDCVEDLDFNKWALSF